MKKALLTFSICFLFGAFALQAQQASYAGKKSGNITKQELLSDSVLSMGEAYEVISFTVSLIKRGSSSPPTLDIPVEGNKVPEKIRSMIKDLPTGSKVYFEHIKGKLIKGSDNAPRLAEALSFTIVDK